VLSQALELADEQAHVWLLPTAQLPPAAALGAERLLCELERQRAREFAVEAARLEFVTARAFVRSLLSRYLGVSPQALAFESSEFGKPLLCTPPGAERLDFNVSHTAGLTVCALARSAWVGVDVECVTREADTTGIAERFFSAGELRALSGLSPERRLRRFYELWTLKEAYAKALGLGLSLPLESTCFEFGEGDEGELVGLDRQGSGSASAQFMVFGATPEHLLALALVPPRPAARYRLVTNVFTVPWWPAES
jgi:4'-phosphopantetheinyl transferase